MYKDLPVPGTWVPNLAAEELGKRHWVRRFLGTQVPKTQPLQYVPYSLFREPGFPRKEPRHGHI